MLSSLMNPLSTRLKLYRLAIGACGFDAADSGGVGFSPSFDVCADEYPQEQMRMTASASVETRMAPSSEQRWNVRSLTPTRHRLNPNTPRPCVSQSCISRESWFLPPNFQLFLIHIKRLCRRFVSLTR